MRKLQDQLEMHQRELNVLQQKLGQGQMVYYLDPNQGLMQQSGPAAMSDVHSLQDQIEKKKAEIDADQEAIENLQVEVRRAGGEAGWLRLDERPSQTAGAEHVQPGEEPKSKEDWQARFESARRRLASAREQQQLAEDELGLLETQYVRDSIPTPKLISAIKSRRRKMRSQKKRPPPRRPKKISRNFRTPSRRAAPQRSEGATQLAVGSSKVFQSSGFFRQVQRGHAAREIAIREMPAGTGQTILLSCM